MASVYPKDGILWLSWYENDKNGRRIRPQISLNLKDTKANRKIAETIKKQKEIELSFNRNKYFQKIELELAIKKFNLTKADRSARTKNIYYYALKLLLKQPNIKYADDVTTETINEIKNSLVEQKRSKSTIATYLKHTKIFYNYLVQEKLVSENPVKKIEYDSSKAIKVLNDEQLENIFTHFKNRNMKHYHFLKLLYLTGLRVSEAVVLEWSDIDYNNRLIKIRNIKAKREEYLPLTGEMEKLLNEIEKTTGRIFNYKTTDSLKTIKRELLKIGKYTFHDFRRTFGTK